MNFMWQTKTGCNIDYVYNMKYKSEKDLCYVLKNDIDVVAGENGVHLIRGSSILSFFIDFFKILCYN